MASNSSWRYATSTSSRIQGAISQPRCLALWLSVAKGIDRLLGFRKTSSSSPTSLLALSRINCQVSSRRPYIIADKILCLYKRSILVAGLVMSKQAVLASAISEMGMCQDDGGINSAGAN